MPTANRVVIYTRVSSQGQEDNSSLRTQHAACGAYAEQHGWTIVGTFTDVHTGAEYRERPGLSALREKIRTRAVDVVLAHALDRISRNQAHLAILAEEIEDHGARLEFVTEAFEDSRSASSSAPPSPLLPRLNARRSPSERSAGSALALTPVGPRWDRGHPTATRGPTIATKTASR